MGPTGTWPYYNFIFLTAMFNLIYDLSYYFKLIDKEILRILTSNLFLSMIPLHKDNEQRMIVLLIIGISLFYDIDMNSYSLEK